MLARLGQVFAVFFLVNIILSPLPARTSLAVDLLTAATRIGIAGLVVGFVARQSWSMLWYRVWALLPPLLVVAALGWLLFALVTGRRVFVGAILGGRLRD